MTTDSHDSNRLRGPTAPERSANSPKRVLVIEDNCDAAEVLGIWLKTFGHDVRIANSGEEGVSVAADWHPHIVVSDIGLPGEKDGYAVARALRGSNSAPYLIALSGYGNPRAKAQAHEAGFDAYVTKPLDVSDLARLLAAATERQCNSSKSA